MNIVNLKGGLGNQFFQYSFGKHLQKETDKTIKYDTTWFETDADYEHDILYLDWFNTDYQVASKKEINKLFPFNQFGKNIAKRTYNVAPIISQSIFGYVKEVEGNKSTLLGCAPYNFQFLHNINSTGNYFDGWWQVSQYVNNVSNILHREFTMKTPMSDQSEIIKKK